MGVKERVQEIKEDQRLQKRAKRMYNNKGDDLERHKAICGVGLMRDRWKEN